METLWTRGACSVRELQEAFPEKNQTAFTTVRQWSLAWRSRKRLRLTKRIGKANIFEAAVYTKARAGQAD